MKGITFRLEEEIERVNESVEQGIYNGFGKMVNLPPKINIKLVNHGFNVKELANCFIELGEMLLQENGYIENIQLTGEVRPSARDILKEFQVKFVYDIKELE